MRSPTLVHFAKALLVSLSLLGAAATARAESVPFTVTFFNIRWFGLTSDEAGAQLVESRAPTIRDYLTDHDAWADIMIFEEIVDVALLSRDVLENRYDCRSYTHRDRRHQHVVVCAGNGYTLGLSDDDDNYLYEEVAMGEKRPAVHGIIHDPRGNPVAHVIGVHLKASPDYSEVRLTQMNMIASHLRDRRSSLPVILAGDVNSYADDAARFDAVFGVPEIGLTQVPTDGAYTWRTPSGNFDPGFFDRAWVSGLRALAPARVNGPCNGEVTQAELQRYYDEVSDHCAVTIRFQR